MEVLLALASGVLYAAGIYLMLRRRLAQLIIGLGLLSNGTNLLIFTAGGLTRAHPPVVPRGRRTAGAAVRRPGSAGARPHRDRDRLRAARLLARAGASRSRNASGPTTWTTWAGNGESAGAPDPRAAQHGGDPAAGAEAAAAAAMDRAGRVDAPARQRGRRCSGGSRPKASRCCRSADGRRRSASPWSPICSRPCSCVAVGVVGVAVTAAAFAGVDPRREAFGYHPLIQILLMGVSGAFLTGDLFNLYVWFEVMLVASFVLMALHRDQRAGRGGIQVRHDQPDRVLDLPHRARAAVRRGRNAQHGGSREGLADDAHAGHRHGAGGAVRDCVQHQGRTVPAVLLAARVLSHAAGARSARRSPGC